MNRLLVSAPLFVGLLGLSACSSEEAIPTDIKVDPIEWSTCDDYPEDESLECGVLEVPLDYSDLEGETIEISLIRIPATSSKPKGVKRIEVCEGYRVPSGIGPSYKNSINRRHTLNQFSLSAFSCFIAYGFFK